MSRATWCTFKPTKSHDKSRNHKVKWNETNDYKRVIFSIPYIFAGQPFLFVWHFICMLPFNAFSPLIIFFISFCLFFFFLCVTAVFQHFCKRCFHLDMAILNGWKITQLSFQLSWAKEKLIDLPKSNQQSSLSVTYGLMDELMDAGVLLFFSQTA